MGIRDKRIAPRSPWQSGSIRRECTDHIIVLGEANLRRVCGNHDPRKQVSPTEVMA
jgi:hypothetical protein